MKPLFSAIFILLLSAHALAVSSLVLPTDLTSEGRKSLLRILGYGSQTKLLSSPVPLGGHQGFEVGLSSEYIPVGDIAGLGSGTDAQDNINIMNLSFGKGFAYNLDGFMQFTVLPQSERIFAYGGGVRWGFYEFEDFPGLLSGVVHASGANYQNLLDSRTTGIDLIMTLEYRDAALFFGGGPIQAFGSFMGGLDGLTASDDGGTPVAHQETLRDWHYVVGATMSFDTLYLALEMDHVTELVYGGRLGLRF